MSAPTKPRPAVRHEEFCGAVVAGDEPRMESYQYLADDPATGRGRATHHVTRCIDCGATSYKQIGA